MTLPLPYDLLNYLIWALLLIGVYVAYIHFRKNKNKIDRLQEELNFHDLQQKQAHFLFAFEDRQGKMIYASKRFREKFNLDKIKHYSVGEHEYQVLGLIVERYDLYYDNAKITAEKLIQQLKRQGSLHFLAKKKSNNGYDRPIRFRVAFIDDGGRVWSATLAPGLNPQDVLSDQKTLLMNSFLQQAPFAYLTCDEDHIIHEVNYAAERLLFDETTLVNKKEGLRLEARIDLFDLVSDKDRTKLISYLSVCRNLALLEPLKNEQLETIHIELKGRPKEVFTLYASYLVPEGAVQPLYMIHMMDVSERRKLENQFAQSQKMQAVGHLAGGIAHDFNNMLTAIIGFCDLLLMRHQPGDHSFVDTMLIKQNANRAAGLVRQLLTFSRREEMEARPLNVVDSLSEISSLLERLIGDRIELQLHHGRDLGHINFDQVQFEQLIINLAVNARDAMPNGGELKIQTDRFTAKKPYPIRDEIMPIGDYIAINVTDTGYGIAADEVDKIFDPFYTTKDVGQGTGLGLSMVYGAVHQAGGFIFVQSGGVDQGATFVIYLPRIESAKIQERPKLKETDALQDVTGRGYILLVEDEDPVRLFATRALRSKGYWVTEARSGEAALEIIAEDQKFDLLITDMMMPRVSGVDVIQAFRKKHPAVPAICISGYTQDSITDDVEKLGNIHFLPKPFSLKILAGRVKQVIDSANIQS